MNLIEHFIDSSSELNIFDDRVMGGVSQSNVSVSKEKIFFSGNVRTENNGGFCSFRFHFDPVDISQFNFLSLSCSGSSREFEIRFFNSTKSGAIAYRYPIACSEVTKEVLIPLSELRGVFRGSDVLRAPAFDRKNLQAVGFLTGKKVPGPFEFTASKLEFQ